MGNFFDDLSITNIFVIISSFMVAGGTVVAAVKSFRKKIANKLFSLVDMNEIDPKSHIYKTLILHEEILQKIDEMNKKKNEEFKIINENLLNNSKILLRLQLLQLLDHRPMDKITIYNLYEEYKVLGGNTYINKLIKEWEEDKYITVEKIVDNSIKKFVETTTATT